MRSEVDENMRYAVLVLDSISEAQPFDAGRVIICGSHGGVISGEYAARVTPLFVSFNDAGVGKDGAGIQGLSILERLDIPACTVSNQTAKIGDGMDSWRSGVISTVNEAARRLGVKPGGDLAVAVHSVVDSEISE